MSTKSRREDGSRLGKQERIKREEVENNIDRDATALSIATMSSSMDLSLYSVLVCPLTSDI